MEPSEFKDYYEILEISPNANTDTIDRVFRYLAQRYHPDIHGTGDQARFTDIVKAHETLRIPEKRAQYDIEYKKYLNHKLAISEEESQKVCDGLEENTVRNQLLKLLYVKRRRNMNNPGIGNLELERLMGCPREYLEFHLWYLKEKGWVSRLDNGLLSITAAGVDQSNLDAMRLKNAVLLTDQRNAYSF